MQNMSMLYTWNGRKSIWIIYNSKKQSDVRMSHVNRRVKDVNKNLFIFRPLRVMRVHEMAFCFFLRLLRTRFTWTTAQKALS
jgi:hypothetical protein